MSAFPLPLRQHGGTFVGFVIGLVLGLAIAVAVALFVTRAPIPFVNKVGRAPAPLENLPDASKLPDPNKPLYPKESSKAADAPDPALPASATPTAKPAETVDNKGGATVVEKSTGVTNDAEIKQSFLQAGAFKSADDAENMKAKLALLGFEARVSITDRDGGGLFRVRVGPYARADDINRARQRLTENGIQPVVVPVGK